MTETDLVGNGKGKDLLSPRRQLLLVHDHELADIRRAAGEDPEVVGARAQLNVRQDRLEILDTFSNRNGFAGIGGEFDVERCQPALPGHVQVPGSGQHADVLTAEILKFRIEIAFTYRDCRRGALVTLRVPPAFGPSTDVPEQARGWAGLRNDERRFRRGDYTAIVRVTIDSDRGVGSRDSYLIARFEHHQPFEGHVGAGPAEGNVGRVTFEVDNPVRSIGACKP